MQLDEFGMLGTSVVRILFRLGGQLGVCALGLRLRKGKLLRKCLELELTRLISTRPLNGRDRIYFG